MKSVFFIEFAQDVPQLLERLAPDDTIIALRPEACFELDIRHIPYRCLQTDYYTYQEFRAHAAGLRAELLNTLHILDDRLWRICPEYRTAGIKPFEKFIYYFKMSLDVLKCEIFELDTLFAKEMPDTVKLIAHWRRPFNNSEDFCFYDTESVYEGLIYALENKYNYAVEAIGARYEESDLRDKPVCKERTFMQAGKDLLRNIPFLKRRPWMARGAILSVNCYELRYLKEDLTKLGWYICEFPAHICSRKEPLSSINGSEIFNELFQDEKTRRLFEYRGVDFFEMMSGRFECFCQGLSRILDTYKILSNYIGRHHFDIVFFNSHDGFSPENVILPQICKERHIPYVCWMHGGYGANYAVHGYEISDFMFGQHYFVYGEEVKKLIDSRYGAYNLVTRVAGSPKILKSCGRYRPAPHEGKKVITVVVPPWGTNCFHANTDCRYSRFSYWVPLKATFELLTRYKDKYRIIIRAVGSKGPEFKLQFELFQKFLKQYHAEDVEIICMDEMPFDKILNITDLFINFWVSTTFWEECLADADIFLMDSSDLTAEAKENISKRAFWYDDLSLFIQALRQYLDKGAFCIRNKDQSFLNNYMDFAGRDRIAEHVSQEITDIIESRYRGYNGHRDKRVRGDRRREVDFLLRQKSGLLGSP